MTKRKVRGYWQKFINVVNELQIYVDELGYVPSTNYLSKVGRSDLARGIEKYHSMADIKTFFNKEGSIRKDLNKYADISVLKEEFLDFSKTIMHIPTYEDFYQNKKSYLLHAINKYFSSYTHFKTLIGVKLSARPTGYWKSITNFKREALAIKEKYGFLPSSSFLNNEGYSSFVNAVYLHYSSFNKLRISLNEKLLQQKEPGYWSTQNFLYEARKIIEEFGYFLSPKELRENNKADLLAAIYKVFGSVENFIKKFDLPLSPKYKKTNYSDSEYQDVLIGLCNELGHFPSYNDFISRGLIGLKDYLIRKYGGLQKANYLISQKLNIPSKVQVAKDGHYCDSYAEKVIDDLLFENNIRHSRNVILDLPEKKCVPDFLLTDNVIIEVLMYDPDVIPSGSIIQKEYIEKYLRKRKAYLKNKIYVIEVDSAFVNDLIYIKAILDEIKMVLSEINIRENVNVLKTANRKPIGYWISEDNLFKDLLPICKFYGRMPTYNELILLGRGDLIHAINRHHTSFRVVGEKIGFPIDDTISHKPRGFWKDNIDFIIKEIDHLFLYYKRFPTSTEVIEYSKSLYYAINRYYGGLRKLQERYW